METNLSTPRLVRPLRDFLRNESAGAVLLAIGAVAALAIANSSWSGGYHSLLETDAGLRIGSWSISMDLHSWINDGLMALFFLVVGLEIKRELVEGELASPRQAALPAVAALGGMVLPAVLFVVITAGTTNSGAWGIPMATDIALALGDRVPASARIFLLALAIVDDIGAILVIAVVYNSGISWPHLAGAGICVVGVVVLGRLRPDLTIGFVALGLAMWWFTHEAGVHATLAGVVMGLLTPTSPRTPEDLVDETVLIDLSSVNAAKETIDMARASVSRVEWLEHVLHPWTSLLIVPVFAFANSGVVINSTTIGGALDSRLALGIAVGLLVGKPVGIVGAVWVGRRFGLELPEGVTLTTIAALGIGAGIGFTVSIFVADLAVTGAEDIASAKVAIIVTSFVAAAAGATAVLASGRRNHDVPTPA